MAYLTNYTFNKLCKRLDIKQEIDLQAFIDYIYKDESLFYFFNKLELKYLFNYKNLLENDEKYIVEYYQKVPQRRDTKSYVFEKPGKLKYHLTNECEFLKQDYIDFHIPQDIIDLGDNVVEEFRNWFKLKKYAEKYFQGKLDVSKVVFDYNMRFTPKYNLKPLNESYKLVIELPNSKVHDIHSEFNYNAFLNNIEEIKKKRTFRFQCKVTRTLSKFDFLINKTDKEIKDRIAEVYSDKFIENYGLDNLKDLFRYSLKLKRELLKNLTAYFKWSFENKNLNIDELTLDKFELKCCSCCKENILNEIN